MIRKLKSGKYRLYSRKVDKKLVSGRISVHSTHEKPLRNTSERFNISNGKGNPSGRNFENTPRAFANFSQEVGA